LEQKKKKSPSLSTEKLKKYHSPPEDKHSVQKKRGSGNYGMEKKEDMEVHFVEINSNRKQKNKLTRNSSLPDLEVFSHNKIITPEKSPRKITREAVGKSPLRSTREGGGKSQRIQREELEGNGPGIPEKITTERQKKILEVWLRFSEIYAGTIELLHLK